ncbi:MAG: methyltransferase domain-containing protein [Bryobacterales bacterium]|nr:methyltransferase domain-containing protein [Bryobacterales bacterium]
MTHLEIAIRQRFASMKLADDAVTRHWLEYALGTNERAAAVVGKLLEFVPTLAGLRFLDVGCGYGGVCIRAALAGATAVGVDVDSGLLKTAQANLADHPGVSVEFLEKNILEDAEPEASLGCFDIIVSDNVIEHVPSAERLICSIARLLAPGGLLYMTVPNARSAGQVLADCHYQTFGMSLLDSEDAKAYLASFDTGRPFGLVEYHDWAHYEATFRKYGLRPRTINAGRTSHPWPHF